MTLKSSAAQQAIVCSSLRPPPFYQIEDKLRTTLQLERDIRKKNALELSTARISQMQSAIDAFQAVLKTKEDDIKQLVEHASHMTTKEMPNGL
jgi:hypothetical protein